MHALTRSGQRLPLLLTACLPKPQWPCPAAARARRPARSGSVGQRLGRAYSLEDTPGRRGCQPPPPIELGLKRGETVGSQPIDRNDGRPALCRQWKHDPEKPACELASHGKRLGPLGNHDAATSAAARPLDNLQIVPIQTTPGVLKAS